jgi:Bacterial mobilisation protein (MobC)
MADAGIVPVQQNRLRRVSGGRPRQVILRLTVDEHMVLQSRAANANVSVQRYLLEASLSGKAGDGAARRRAERELGAARGVLRAVGNNLNQLAKWANANGTLPSHLEPILTSVASATSALSERVEQLAATLERPL